MKLENKKDLASRALGIGKNRIVFNSERLNEVKEAITKQDIKDLLASKAIMIREIKGRKKVERSKRRRGPGSIRKKVKVKKWPPASHDVWGHELRRYRLPDCYQAKLVSADVTE